MAESLQFPQLPLVGGYRAPSETEPTLDLRTVSTPDTLDVHQEETVVEETTGTVEVGRSEETRVRRLASAAKEFGQAAVAVAVLSPLNEVARLAAFGAGYSVSRDPAMGAFTLGASTFLVEGAGAMAAASLLGSERAQRLNAALEKRIHNKEDGAKTSKVTKAVAALAIGATASMAIEHIEDPHRTVAQNRKHGLLTSAWLGGVLAIGGAAGTEAVTATIENPAVVAPMAGSVALMEVARRKWRSMRRPHEVEDILTEEWRDSDKRYEYHLLTDPTETIKAAITEQDVWDEKGFGKLDEAGYTEHIKHSRTFVAFNKDEECAGVNRMFGAYEDVLPPFLELPFNSEEEREALSQRARDGKLEELGTVAVVEDARGQGVNGRLWRLAYRDAVARGVEEWGIIMEPERVAKLNKYHGFTFRQLGSAVDYQGGDCAAFVMNLEESVANMQKKHPLQQFALVRLRLKP
jgi:hypothetical protein